MLNRALALAAFLFFLAFFSVLIGFVPHPDLVAVVGIGIVLAGYDIWHQLRRRSR
jgi:xanthosine utilization system XapX-like protein